jgi:DNA-binding NtrC family response regulator
MNGELDAVIDGKVKPLLQAYQQKFLGVRVSDIEQDITDQLKRSTLLDFSVDTRLPFKQAKKAFKRAYLMRLLKQHLGNISAAAAIAGIDRRSIHRLVCSLKIPAARLREDAKPEYARQAAVQGIIQDVLESYKSALNPIKYKAFSAQTEALSDDIVKKLPEYYIGLKEAEQAFERAYISQLLKENKTIAEASKKAGLRYEVMHRKIKALGIRAQNA